MMLTELAADLVTGLSYTVGTNLFINHFPPKPSNIVSLHNQQSAKPIRAMSKTLDHEVRIVQVIGRDANHDSCETKIRAIYLRWDMFEGTLSGVRYVSILAIQTPVYLNVDENDRFRWSCMFEVRRIPS
jgi:hypothetical protein